MLGGCVHGENAADTIRIPPDFWERIFNNGFLSGGVSHQRASVQYKPIYSCGIDDYPERVLVAVSTKHA